MRLPEPVPGLVIRYSYLWRREHGLAREEGSKDRPCAVVLSAVTSAGKRRVFVLPVTHTPPRDPGTAVEIPPKVKRHLGLDGERSWIMLDEFNVFHWPGFDLRPVPGSRPARVAYGTLPPAFYDKVRDAFLMLYRARRVRSVPRG